MANLQFEVVKKIILNATQATALAVHDLILQKGFSPTDQLTDEESKLREREIDQVGVDAMGKSLKNAPFKIEIVGSEGKKHIFDYGESMPTFEGIVGKGKHTITMVNDVVEGSKTAKLNTPGAVSVIAVSTHQGLMPTPPEISYMDKLFGPPQLKGKMSIDFPVEKNLQAVCKTFSIKPQEINMVMMDRDRNADYIEAAQKFGANVILIKAGDFLPSILSVIDPSFHKKGIHLIMGIGGFEEGVMAVCATKAVGGFAQGRCWDPDKEKASRYQKTLLIDDMVPGKKEDCFVSISFITKDDKWFDLSGISQEGGRKVGYTLSVSEDGPKVIKTVY